MLEVANNLFFAHSFRIFQEGGVKFNKKDKKENFVYLQKKIKRLVRN